MIKDSQAIVLGAGPNGLGAIRSLNIASVSVDVITQASTDPSMYSNLPLRKVHLTTAFDVDELNSRLLAWPGQGQVLIPTSDWFVNYIFENQALLRQKFKIIVLNSNLTSKIIDKREEVELVAKLIDIPKSVPQLPKTVDELLMQLNLPIIIKPRSNELNHLNCKNILITSKETLQQFYERHGDDLDFCIAQQVILGPDDAQWVCNCVFDQNHKLMNSFVFQRLQLSPPHFGVSSYARSAENQQIVDMVARLGEGLKYVGPAMVEFKYDDQDKLFKYIEINPRLGLLNYFDTQCGKNNVYAFYCLAKQIGFLEKPQKSNRYYLSFYEDIYSRYRDGQSSASILKTYLSHSNHIHYFMYFTWRDPWPCLVVGWWQLSRTMRSLLKKIAAGFNVNRRLKL